MNPLLLLNTGRIKIEFRSLDATLHVYRDGNYLGCEDLLESVNHLLDESPMDEHIKIEQHGGGDNHNRLVN